MSNLYSSRHGKHLQSENHMEESLRYRSLTSTPPSYSKYVDSDDESLQIVTPSKEVASFLADIQKTTKPTPPIIFTMSRILQKDQRYNILNVREVETKYGRKQVWKLQKIGDDVTVEVWTPYSASKHITDSNGTICEHRKSLLLQTVLKYNGFDGGMDQPTRYKLDFLAL